MSFDLRRRRRAPHFARGDAYARMELEQRFFAASGMCFVQHDMDIANGSGATVRADINNALDALATLSSGATAPGTTQAYQLWADTTAGLLKQRNAANTAWEVRGTLAETMTVARSSNTIIAAGDFGKTFICTSTFTQTLTAAATLGDGFIFWIRNNGAGVITIDPNLTETIDGATTIDLGPGEAVAVFCDGSNFFTVGNRTNGEYRSVQVFTGSGTWTKPAGIKRVEVTVVGGGGAGGGAPATSASQHSLGTGGGGGGASIKTIAAASLGATETVTVGAGGTANSGAAGGAGGTSSFGAHCSATGGAGGSSSIATAIPGVTGAVGGVGSSGDINIQGGGSNSAWSNTNGTLPFVPASGGGSSILGGGGRGTTSASSAVAGGNYGGGGSGAALSVSAAALAGGAGAGGVVIVKEFF